MPERKRFFFSLRPSLTSGIGRLEESGCGPLSAQRGWRLGAVELAEVVVHLEGGGDDSYFQHYEEQVGRKLKPRLWLRIHPASVVVFAPDGKQ